MEPFNFLDVGIVGHETSKWHRQIISQTAFLTSLVLQVINQFAILAVLPCQHLLQLKNRCVYLYSSMLSKNAADCVDDFTAHSHLIRVEIPGSLGRLDLK